MKKFFLFVLLIGIFSSLHFINSKTDTPDSAAIETETEAPDDYLYRQRAYPHNHIDFKAYQSALQQTKVAKSYAAARSANDWEMAGSTNIGGRITDLAIHPINPLVIYAGTSVGGIFKTKNGGQSWTPVFDDAGALSIGNLALAPSDWSVLYAGTGEANGSATSGAFFGNGMYKSIDDGQTWQHIGLEETQHIGRIAIDHQNADRVYVAAAGKLYAKDSHRGLYRTTDGGANWKQVLFVNDSTSCIDVVVNPQNADIVYAATWERIRQPWERSYAGPGTALYRSTNGGDTWQKLTNGLPIDSETGRIGIQISQTIPNILYVSLTTDAIQNRFKGVYKTSDGGNTWDSVYDGDLQDVYASFGWFFGNIRIDPLDPDVVYVMGVQLYKTIDGGQNWDRITGDMHVDQHALEIDPLNTDRLIAGNDGGLYISENGGSDWEHINKLPITQYYNCEVDDQNPEQLYGGTQDNGTIRTTSGAPDDWERILGGDGFHVLVDPLDNNYIYAEYQWGGLRRSTNGGANFMNGTNGIDGDDRTNWNTPVVFDPSDPTVLYYGSNRLYRSTDRAQNWSAISDDLTKGIHPSGSLTYGTITTIGVAPSDSKAIYVGTDDGVVQRTTDGGDTWTNISNGIPDRYITKVAVFPNDAEKVIVTISGYRNGDYQPHVLMSDNSGNSWSDISGNLPEIPVNDIIIDPINFSRFYIANDMGVWFTNNDGSEWNVLGSKMPITVVNDIELHEGSRTLIAATFGRSMFRYDLSDIDVAVNGLTGIDGLAVSIFPNPVHSEATISLQLKNAADIQIILYDMSGKLCEQVFAGKLEAGAQQIIWQPKRELSGVYQMQFVSKGGMVSNAIRIVL